MKVLYQIFVLLFFLSCAPNVYKIAHEHLERSNPSLTKLGIWSYEAYWVELYDDESTSWPFDEAVWMSTAFGRPDYVDVVFPDGNVYRYGYHLNKKKFIFLYVVPLDKEKHTNINPFQYYDAIVNQGRVPI